jgi:hypothetical protein
MSRSRLLLGISVLGLGATIIFWNHGGPMGRALATEPPQAPTADPQVKQVAAIPASEYGQRAVAYIYNDSIKITREELGEYLIERMQENRLESLVNLRIIQHYCAQKGIEVTPAEVDAEFAETMKGIPNCTPKVFYEKVLKPHNKTLYEWKEDVVKPRIMLARLCRDRVHVTEDDIKMAFDAYYGEKVECRIILWKSDQKNVAMNIYGKIRDSEEEFDRAARSQESISLAQSGGRIAPIGHNTAGNATLEKAAFSLKPGELSEVLETPEGVVVLKCVKRIPPDATKHIEAERDKLAKEVFDKKVQLEIPKVFRELRDQANPKIILKDHITETELIRDVKESLKPETTAQSH